MKFNLNDCSIFMSHLLLEDATLADKVSHTKPWLDNQTLEATLQINGVEVPASHIEDFMKSLWKRHEESVESGYKILKTKQDDFNNQVELKAKEILRDHADDAISKLVDMQNSLHNIEDTITPHWERN